jgi:rubredoxin
MSHWYCPSCEYVWDDHLPESMEIDASTSDDVVAAFVLPGTCPLCGLWETEFLGDPAPGGLTKEQLNAWIRERFSL